MTTIDHMVLALGQLEMADAAVKPGDLPDLASANLHTSIFYLLAAIGETNNPTKQLAQADAAIAK